MQQCELMICVLPFGNVAALEEKISLSILIVNML